MKRSVPIKRSGLRAKAPAKAERAPIVHQPLTRAPNYARSSVSLPVPKLAPVRSEEYRRLVAALPCIACGIEGYSQHAHGNYGKGMSLKTCDLFSFPLCCARPGIVGCHAEHDQGGQNRDQRRAKELEWAHITINAIRFDGDYPRGLPVPEWA